MGPLNRNERRKAFLNFLLIFTLTIAAIVTVVFISIEVPFKQTEVLQKKVMASEMEKQFSDSFNAVMREALVELKGFEQPNVSAFATKEKVKFKIDKLRKLIKDKSDAEKTDIDNTIYGSVVQNLAELNDAKSRIRELEEQKGTAQSQ